MTGRLIGVIGPGIVGMPMAALLARAEMRRGADGGRVLVIQRDSPTSGWKVPAINAGRSPIGGVEPSLDAIVAEAVAAGRLLASHNVSDLTFADFVLVCVQTDKRGLEPEYGPLFEALDALALAFTKRPAGLEPPIVIIESTLAPSSMATVVRERFARRGLIEGQHVRLGNSPNRVMPGRLVERVVSSDKLVGGLSRATAEAIAALYAGIVTQGTIHVTNSLTAEIVKTLENAYRDVRIAFSAEVVRWCDAEDIDFFALRDAVNARIGQSDAASANPSVVPSGGLLVPTVGVGGHCLPKDGILLWWRRLEAADPAAARSLILESRRINDESPSRTLALAERAIGPMRGRRVTVLGAAYRFDSEDTRNSPSLVLANLLRDRGARISLHDPYVRDEDQNLRRTGLDSVFTRELGVALVGTELVILCTAHGIYHANAHDIIEASPNAMFVDACNLWTRDAVAGLDGRYVGIGRGRRAPVDALIASVAQSFATVEHGVSNEIAELATYLNARFAEDVYSETSMDEIRRLAASCVTGCTLPPPGPTGPVQPTDFDSRLARLANDPG